MTESRPVSDLPPTSVLSDGTIRRLVAEGRIAIEPWDPDLVQPASVDLRLGDSFRVFHNHRASAIDLREPPSNLTEQVKVDEGEPFVIHPGEFCLGRTLEYVELPDDIVARIEGKALALDTLVPTPSGWRTMGDLRVGDEVFGPDGQPVPVIHATSPLAGRECREVVFSDGTAVVADVAHQWEVSTRNDRRYRRAPRVLTTAELERSGLKSGPDYCFCVEQCAPVQYPERELPIDPYVFGAWIGDGTSTTAVLSTVAEPILEEVALAGCAASPASGPSAYRAGGSGPRTVTKLANQTLAQRFNVGRAIVDIRPHPSVPVRCIEVGSPRGVYLITDSFIPTHNSSLGRLGLIVHATAGFCDPGWRGTLTLELNNLTRVPIKLYPGLPIAQLSFMTLDAPAERPYGHAELGSRYQGQVEATESRYGSRT